MCYLVAKSLVGNECVAVETENSLAIKNLMIYLRGRKSKDIMIFLVSALDEIAYCKPYEVMGSEREFICRVLDME